MTLGACPYMSYLYHNLYCRGSGNPVREMRNTIRGSITRRTALKQCVSHVTAMAILKARQLLILAVECKDSNQSASQDGLEKASWAPIPS